MSSCSECGHDNNTSEWKFCANCGHKNQVVKSSATTYHFVVMGAGGVCIVKAIEITLLGGQVGSHPAIH
jgi:hypothetical protein